MMEKLLIDSVVTWARDYKVDGFRFDLMGHHPRATMLNLRAALDELTVADDGVDGATIYLYGEGWNFGEVADDARFVQATQLNMGGTGIGTFNDRLRDAVRGGGPFDGGESLVRNQGVINGLWYDPNELSRAGSPTRPTSSPSCCCRPTRSASGSPATSPTTRSSTAPAPRSPARDVDYNGAPAGYTEDPQEHIVYVEAHDNQTLFDIGQYHHPLDTSTADRVRAQNLGLDFTRARPGRAVRPRRRGAAAVEVDGPQQLRLGRLVQPPRPVRADEHVGVGAPAGGRQRGRLAADRPAAAPGCRRRSPPTWRRRRSTSRSCWRSAPSSPLFRLGTAAEVQERLAFANTGPDQVPGLIVMTLDDPAVAPRTTGDLDPDADRLAVLFNPTDDDDHLRRRLVGRRGRRRPAPGAGGVGRHRSCGGATFDAATGTLHHPGSHHRRVRRRHRRHDAARRDGRAAPGERHPDDGRATSC